MLGLFLNPLRGAIANIANPVAEWREKRAISPKIAALKRQLRLPYAQRLAAAQHDLGDLLRFAAANVPYYADLFSRLSFDVEKAAQEPARLAELPCLTKDIIREQGERLLRRDHEKFRKHLCKTGGSTGISAHIWYDQEAADWSAAVTRACRDMTGANLWRHQMHFASRFPEKFPLKDRIREEMKCAAMNRSNVFFDQLDDAGCAEIWQKIRLWRPYLVHAHPSTIYQLALYVQKKQGRARMAPVFESSGEVLSPKQRALIAHVLQCRVIDRYGLAEAGVVAYQLDDARPCRFLDPVAWPEILPLDEPDTQNPDLGEIVLTPLANRLMPLIRYRTGDLGCMETTEEGRFYREIVGRTHDVITIGATTYATHYIQDLFDRMGGIRQFQILPQATPLFRIVAEDDARQNEIRQRITGWFGDRTAVEFIGMEQLVYQGARAKFRHLVGRAA